MLDLHAISGTPGAATVLGTAFPTIAPGDGATVAGVPIAPGAVLVLHGANSPTADTIANYKMASQDQLDPLNGETHTPGAASLLNQLYLYSKIPYKTGGRQFQLGTNTGVVAALAYTLDAYPSEGSEVQGDYCMPSKVITGVTTFGGALTALSWGTQAYAPTQALPNGKFAILGAWVSAITNAAIVRFSHSDFKGKKPGFPVANYETISTATWDKAWKEELTVSQVGYQFVHLSQKLGIPSCPTFNVTNNGTGLVIEAASTQADTPVVMLNLAKVG